MKIIRSKSTGLFAVLLLAFSLLPATTFAQNDTIESITLAPTSKRYQIDAGAVKEDTLTVVNDGSTAYDFILYARPYSVKGSAYEPDFEQTPSNADAYEWVQFGQSRWSIEPGQTLEIPYTLRVPSNEAPGGHYGVIFAETQPAQAGSTSVVRKKRVGAIIYATVNGTYTTGGQTLGIDIPGLQFRAPLTSSMTVENSGNADFETQLNLKVSDLFGNIKYEEQKTNVILPATTREMNVEWKDAPWFGLFKVEFNASYLDTVEKKESYVLMIPRWMLVVLGVVIVGGGVYVTLRRRKR